MTILDRNYEREPWPTWIQLVLAVGAVIVAVTMAYAQLDKRMSLLEQKLDFVVQRVK